MGKPRKNHHHATSGTTAPSVIHFPPALLLSSKEDRTPYAKPPRFTTLLPDRIWVIHDFFTLNECQAWIQYMEQDITMELTQQRGNRYYAQRECHRFQRDDAILARRLFARMQPLLAGLPQSLFGGGPPVMCNPNIRLYKYTKGMSFGKHVDESHAVPGWGKTRLTVLIYLSSCQGGATSFEPEVSFEPKEGAMLLHVHGDDCLEHEGKPVQAGIKYILRTDLVYAS